jgi:hypothetical protein
MKSVICQLAWKLGTTMYFCHSILIFKIIPIFKKILVFKIMIVIHFQIWFLIKFKLQKREWVWLKFCFSHAKGLWHYKYRPQWCKRGGGEDKKTLEGNKHKKPQEEGITRENRKKNTKNRGRRDWKEEEESILQSVPALLPSPSPSASLGKVFFFSLFLCNCCKKIVRPKLCLLRVCLAKHTLVP